MAEKKSLDIGGALSGAFGKPVEDDSAPLDLVSGAGLRWRRGGGQEESIDAHNNATVQELRGALGQFRAGSLRDEEFFQVLSDHLQHVNGLLSVFQLSKVQRELEKAEESDRSLAEATLLGLTRVQAGVSGMLSFFESEDESHLDAGLAEVLAGFEDLESTQSEAIERLPEDEEADQDDD